MKIDIEKISESDISLISTNEKTMIRKAKKNYISWKDKWISIEKSYSNFLDKFNNLK